MAVSVTINQYYIPPDLPSGYKSGYVKGNDPVNSKKLHREAGKLTGLGDRNVIHTFGTAFDTKPKGDENFKIYRVWNNGAGYVKSEVLYTTPTEDDWYSETGFEINIDPSEDLTGVVVSFNFTE